MSVVLEALERHAGARPHATALRGDGITLSYGELHAVVDRAAQALRRTGVGVLGLALDNGPAWAIWDLACQSAGITVVPMPGFFTAEQTRYTLADAGVEALIGPGDDPSLPIAGCRWQALASGTGRVPPKTAKVTYTSGTTGRPKGVCLAQSAIDRVVVSLTEAAGANTTDRHLALLPLAVLLENIGGLYVPLFSGATAVLEPLARIGVAGSSRVDPARMLAALGEARATTAITVPALLDALLQGLEQGAAAPDQLRYLAVGGAAVSPHLLARAHELGLPVFQGYGLSECASVVAVNRPGDDDPASVGRPLAHVDLTFAADGEIQVRTEGFLGYLGEPPPAGGWWPTGDLGHLDRHGRLHIHGRKKNLFITAFGRNVSPEWVEAELGAEPAVQQVAVFGEARPWNTAVIVSGAPDAAVGRAIENANRRLPDYAQVRCWLRATAPFTPDNGLATANGRVRRAAVSDAYGAALDFLYTENHTTEVAP